MSYGNGLWRTTNYDTDGRITGISTSHGVPIQSLTYGFDANDLITAITRGVDAGRNRPSATTSGRGSPRSRRTAAPAASCTTPTATAPRPAAG